ncbi:hypothetical protein VMCG_09831 [Cytospora schulzeri]|uniref:Uncharacterized protein n=1 Tax=Cytospora schulzeri TaxID=448051 RepID=A0A423VHL1_9PEZI|nr:hypothetical protein VMCG_09831 [Valsa malicola]
MFTLSIINLAILLSPVAALIGPPANENIPNIPPKVDPTKLENFTWSDPFTSPRLAEFDATCTGQRTFSALEFQIHDLQDPEPKGLWPYGDALKTLFGGRPYPGGWEGMDAHGYERDLLKLNYADVPVKVREWIEDQERIDGPGKGLFGVYDKPEKGSQATGTAELTNVDDMRLLDPQRVVIFAPGAVYETLPLWVAEGSDCEDTLANLDNYSPKLVDNGVVGWTTHYTSPRRSQSERKMEFTVKAQVLSANVDPSVEKKGQDTLIPSQATLASLVRCSHQFYDVAAPHLYRSIDLSRTKLKDELRHLEVITALFLRKPELGRSVRHLAIRESNGSDREDDPDDVMPTDAASALELAQSSEYFRDAILLALLVQCLSKLTSLDLELMEPARLRFVQALLHLSGADQLLGHVKTLCLGSSRPEVRLDLWRDLFTLPSISSVYLHRVLALRGQTLWGCGPSSAAVHPLANLKPHSLDITHIEMRDCRIAPWELRRMLEVPKALRTFIYDIGEGTNEMEPPVNISYKSVREALEQQKDSIEQIWIDYPHDYLFDEWGGSGSSTRPMGSFAGFKKLKRFRIASTYLFGFTADTDIERLVDSLPEQLEMLHLTHGDEDEEITAGLQKLLEAKQQGRFEKLTGLSVEVCLPWLISKGREPLAADHNRVNKDVMAELVQKADGMKLEMRLFINHSQSRTYSPPRRVQSATRARWSGPERKELTWGFDGEVNWPPRMSGCMARPEYPEIKIDEQGVIRFTNGDVPAHPVSPGPTLLGPAFLGPILFD